VELVALWHEVTYEEFSMRTDYIMIFVCIKGKLLLQLEVSLKVS